MKDEYAVPGSHEPTAELVARDYSEMVPALMLVWDSTMELLHMRMTPYVYYQEDDIWVGWLEAYPDYRTQGASLEELEENLRDIQQELESGAIPCVHHIGELVVQ